MDISVFSYFKVIWIAVLFFLYGCKQEDRSVENKLLLADSLRNTFRDHTLTFERRADLLVGQLTSEEKILQMMHNAPAIPRLGIPAYNWWNEALHGVARFGKATVFPQPIGMAATFDPELIEDIANTISIEGRAKFNAAQELGNTGQYAGLTYWSPNVNIFRDPRWGRGMETWGEDPYLTGLMGSAFTKGLQGRDGKYFRAMACVKHFAVHSGPEADRHHFNALPSEKDLQETYLPAFKRVIQEGNVQGVMCAYNRLNDKACCADSYLTHELIRNQWGFEGYVVTDCEAVKDFYKAHGLADNKMEASVMAVKAGVNLNCGTSFKALKDALDQGLITEQEIDKAVAQLFLVRFRLGLLDPPSLVSYSDLVSESLDYEKHKQLAYEAALKSIVLLKNNGVLPLKNDLNQLYLIGPLASDVDALLGNYYGLNENMVTILEGITSSIDPGTKLEYRKGFYLDRDNINKTDWAIGEARSSDVVVAVLGLNNELEGEEGESIGSANKSDKVNIELPANQIDYLKQIRENEGKPLVVVMTGGSPLNISEVYEIADAVLWAWYPGQEGGNAVADVLFGSHSPSGRLPITFPRSVNQLPPYEDYSMKGRTYKYGTEDPLFPFGFGLSYTTFQYEISAEQSALTQANDTLSVTVTLTNTGNRDAEEVMQLYVSPNELGDLPKYNLVHFDRISLPPGDSKSFRIPLSSDKLQYINQEGEKAFFDGTYQVWVGGSVPTSRAADLGLDNARKAEITISINQ